jgi:predicted ribosomally synthesized peptide with SipW-like signal peptide
MNTKILMSLVTIGLVASIVGIGTYAYFNDTETSVGNTAAAGVLNLKLNGCDGTCTPSVVHALDLKPSFTRYSTDINLSIENNPGKLYKRVTEVLCSNNGLSEPEKVEETLLGCEKNNLDNYTWIDVERKDGAVWNVVVPDYSATMKELLGKWIYLGEYPIGDTIIRQSFHLKAEVTNWAQTDKCIFSEEFMLNQVNAPDPDNCWNCPLVLENKNSTGWFIIDDGRYAVLNFIPKGPEFFYDLKGYSLEPSTEYSLIYYADPWAGNHPGALIAQQTTAGDGSLAVSGSVNLGIDLPEPADANYAIGAKIWLVPSSDYDATTKSMKKWDESRYYFETHKIWYDDTNA